VLLVAIANLECFCNLLSGEAHVEQLLEVVLILILTRHLLVLLRAKALLYLAFRQERNRNRSLIEMKLVLHQVNTALMTL
jgi:hypothetical protein